MEVTVKGLNAVGPNFMVDIDIVGISSVNQDSAREGDQLTIKGLNFYTTASENIVTFNGTNIAEVTQVSGNPVGNRRTIIPYDELMQLIQ